MLIFRQLVDPQSSTYTYLLGDSASRAAVLIDPVFEQVRRDAALIDELGLKLLATLETHVHADHVTGAWPMKQRAGSKIMVAKASGAIGADRYLVQDDVIAFGGRRLLVRATPGHTGGCVTYVLDDSSLAFTGDCLLIRGSGRTDFQDGDAAAMYRSVREQIFALPNECLPIPGSRLSRPHRHQRRRGAALQSSARRRYRDRRFRRLHEEPEAGAPASARRRGAGQSALWPAGRRRSAFSRPGGRPELGASALQLCRRLGDRSARARGASKSGANSRCA